MIYESKDENYVLSTGRVIYANRGILGLAPKSRVLYEGFDGAHPFEGDPGMTDAPLTAAERQEIADEMIARWRAWAAPKVRS